MGKLKYNISEFYERAHRNANKKVWPYQRLTRTHSIFFSYVFARIGLSPNTITIMMLVPALLGSILFTSINLVSDIFALLCFHMYVVLDFADGEVARAMNKTSKHGAFLDRVMHMIIHPMIFLSISYHYYTLENNIYIFILGFLYICSDYIKGTIEAVYHSVMGTMSNSNIQKEDSVSTRKRKFSLSNPISYLSGIYTRHFFKAENGWFFLILIYPIDYYSNYEIFDLHLTSITICLFFIFQIIFTLKKIVIYSIGKST